MERRLDLQIMLEEVLGSSYVYNQPPSEIPDYPAIIYEISDITNRFANGQVYTQNCSYMVTVIDRDSDSEITSKLSKIPSCRFDRHYVSDNLNHDVFIIFY